MRKSLSVVLTIVVMLFCFCTVAVAQDIVMDKKIQNVVIKRDKNGAEYVRFIVTDTAQLNGISYQKSVSVVAFGDQVAKAKTYKKGQTLKAIVNKGDYKGNPSYTILELI